MRIALMETCFGQADRLTAFAQAAQAGGDGIELVIHDAPGLSLLESALGQSAQEHGLAIPSVYLLANTRTDGLIRRSEATGLAMQHVREALQATARVGAKVLLLPFLGKAAIEQESEFSIMLDCLSDLEGDAAEAGVVIGVESMIPQHQKRLLLDHTGGGTDVRHYYDVGNAVLRRQDPATELRQLGADGICGVHFKDVRLREGQPPSFNLRLGEGQVDFRAVAQALQAIRYDGWVSLETLGLDDPLATAQHNVQFARKVLGL